jgi:hypothetical protein
MAWVALRFEFCGIFIVLRHFLYRALSVKETLQTAIEFRGDFTVQILLDTGNASEKIPAIFSSIRRSKRSRVVDLWLVVCAAATDFVIQINNLIQVLSNNNPNSLRR